MTEYDLDKYNLSRLRKIGEKMGLPSRRSKNEMIKDIEMAFREYEEYKRDKLDRYKKCQQLGRKGKEGTTYLVVDKHGNEFAMKTFRSSKSSNTLKKEYLLQKKAAAKKISPQVYDYDTVSKYILMEKMDEHFFNLVKNKQKGRIFKFQQKRIIEIFTILDQIGIFHNDANICNYMVKEKNIYIIDFGFAKEITPKLCKTLGTTTPNMKLMLLGFILKLQELNLDERSFHVLFKYISTEDKERFNLKTICKK